METTLPDSLQERVKNGHLGKALAVAVNQNNAERGRDCRGVAVESNTITRTAIDAAIARREPGHPYSAAAGRRSLGEADSRTGVGDLNRITWLQRHPKHTADIDGIRKWTRYLRGGRRVRGS